MFKEEDHPRDGDGKFSEKGGKKLSQEDRIALYRRLGKEVPISVGEKQAKAIRQYSDDPAHDLAAEGLASGEKPKGKNTKAWENNLKPRGQTDLPQGVSKEEFIQSELGVSSQRAKEYVDALDAYSDNKYSEIRAFQRGQQVKDTERIKKISDDLEDYIKKAPRWNGGETFRGAGLTDEQLAAYTIGSEHDMLGVSSWSNEPNIANEFADHYHKREHKANAVIFHSATQTRGTAVRHLSREYGENEVLVSKESRFKVLRRNVDKEGRTHIYLEEV